MADATTWMPLYVGDYLRDTQHLSTGEHGAYFLLLCRAWTSEGLLPRDPERLRRIVGMAPKEWKTAWPVLAEFFTEDDDGFRHKRVDAELSRATDVTEKRRAAANARWEKDSKRNANASANAVQTDMPGILPSQPQSQLHQESEEEDGENNPLPHRALAFSGRTIRLNQRDFDEWQRRYSAIPDLRAELGALDDWLRGQGDDKRKNWFHVASGSLARKHQKFLTEARAADDGELEMPIC